MVRVVLVVLVVLLVVPIAVFAGFTGYEEFGTGVIGPIVWVDYDNDGDLDLAIGNHKNDQQNYLYVNNGNGTFAGQAEFGEGKTQAMAWADYDNDGDPDFAIGNESDQQNYLYVNNGDGTFTGQAEFGEGKTRAMAWADYDNDGDLDLAVGNGEHVEGQNYLYVNNGDGTFIEQAEFGTEAAAFALAWGDYNNDGNLDLAVGTGVGTSNRLFTNNGDGTFTKREEFGGGPTWCNTTSMVCGDFNKDGYLDVAVALGAIIPGPGEYVTGGRLYLNNGDGTFDELPLGSEWGAEAMYMSHLACGDSDNDGDLDMSIGKYQRFPDGTAPNKLAVAFGNGYFTYEPEFGNRNNYSMAWGDYDNDGDLDVAVVTRNVSAPNYLYVNNEDDGDYLVIYLVGHYQDQGGGYSNRDGIGAKVLVYEEGYLGNAEHLLGYREVGGGDGKGQSSIEAEFGIPDSGAVDVLVVWPGSDSNHIEEAWEGVAKSQFITLDEGTGTPFNTGIEENPPNLPRVFSLQQNYPNPFNPMTTIAFTLEKQSPVTLSVYDGRGKLVKILVDQPLSPGDHQVVWKGVENPSGIYFYDLRVSGVAVRRKMLLLK